MPNDPHRSGGVTGLGWVVTEVFPKADEPDLLRPAQAAEQCGVHVSTLARWERLGRLKAIITPGGHRRYRLADIRAITDATPKS